MGIHADLSLGGGRAIALLDIDKTPLCTIRWERLPEPFRIWGISNVVIPIKYAVKLNCMTCAVLAKLHNLYNPIGAIQCLSKVQGSVTLYKMGAGVRCAFTPPSWGEVLPKAQFDLRQRSKKNPNDFQFPTFPCFRCLCL